MRTVDFGIVLAPDATTATVVTLVRDRTRRVLPPAVVETGRSFAKLVNWLHLQGGDHNRLGLHAERGRYTIVLDASHYTASRPCAEVLSRVRDFRAWGITLWCIELSGRDLPRPEPDGWKTKVSRREVLTALSSSLRDGSVKIDKATHGAVLVDELGDLRIQRPRDEEERDGDQVRALALAVWSESLQAGTSTGGFVRLVREGEEVRSPRPEDPIGSHREAARSIEGGPISRLLRRLTG